MASSETIVTVNGVQYTQKSVQYSDATKYHITVQYRELRVIVTTVLRERYIGLTDYNQGLPARVN